MNVEDAKSIEAETARLTLKLKELQSKPGRAVFPLVPEEFRELLAKLAEKKFGKGRCVVTATPEGLVVDGDEDIVAWATTVVNTLKSLSDK